MMQEMFGFLFLFVVYGQLWEWHRVAKLFVSCCCSSFVKCFEMDVGM